jgi:hypothetical protein
VFTPKSVNQKPPAASKTIYKSTSFIADVELPVWTDREAIGSGSGLGDDLGGSIGFDAGDPTSRALDEDDASVIQCDWSLGEFQPSGENT